MADRSRLTEAEKKRNHIESERKRREAIRRSFDALSDVVPNMKGQARSEAVMLQATVAHLTDLIERRDELYDIAMAKGMTKEDFKTLYDEAVVRREHSQGHKSASPARPSSSDSKTDSRSNDRGTTAGKAGSSSSSKPSHRRS